MRDPICFKDLFLLLLFLSNSTVLSKDFSNEELISDAKNISLSRVIQAKYVDDVVHYQIEVISVLKGKIRNLTIIGIPMGHQPLAVLDTFGGHLDPKFWKQFGGRSRPTISGEVLPVLSVGSVFLIFHDKPYHRKSFEFIRRYPKEVKNRDKWLEFVEDTVAPD